VREAATQAAAGSEAASLVEILLGDIRDIFTKRKKNKVERPDEIPSAALVEGLVAIEGHPWAELGKSRKPLTQNGLARRLKPLAIAPDRIGPEGGQARGYCLSQFTEAFGRHLGPEGDFEPSSRQECDEQRASSDFATVKGEPGLTVGKCEKPNNDGLLDGLTLRKGETGEKRHVRTARSDDLPYHGPVVAVPDLPPDTLDEHGAAVAPPPASARIQRLADEYAYRAYSNAQTTGGDPRTAECDAWLRQTLADGGVRPEFVEVEFERVMAEVFRV
jgi:hypothetical protein